MFDIGVPPQEEIDRRSPKPSDTGEFVDYTEVIPGSDVTFSMIAIPGGTYLMGSPESEPYHNHDEGPVHEVTLDPFWMGETEVTWNEFLVYYNRTTPGEKNKTDTSSPPDTTGVDAVSGPTPPYTYPDQVWEPAVRLTHYAAITYCEWLSDVMGKTFRLPTEAEWEYACRAGTTGPYYFEGNPEKLTRKSWKNRLFGTDESIIYNYVWYCGNSSGKPRRPYTNEPNPWGLYNLLGNVKEFCLDLYAPDIYSRYSTGNWGSSTVNPKGPVSGKEHVVRGGSFSSDPADMRAAARGRTYHDEWLLTDPRTPKSIWWYSDSRDVGFRVVREYNGDFEGGKRDAVHHSEQAGSEL